MNQDEHQRERMRAWSLHYSRRDYASLHEACDRADSKLTEFDKRFPAPVAPASEVVPDQSAMGMAVAQTILSQTEELATLRQKARGWDAAGVKVPPSISYGSTEIVTQDFCDGWNECRIEVLRLNTAPSGTKENSDG